MRTGAIAEAGVAVGSCSAVARRLPALEARLVGVAAGADLAGVLDPADLAPLAPIDDLRGSAAYRRDATATLVRRALREVARHERADRASALPKSLAGGAR